MNSHISHSKQEKRWIKQKEITNLFDISRSTLWRWRRNNLFPQPIQIGERFQFWDLHEIEQWVVHNKNNGGLS